MKKKLILKKIFFLPRIFIIWLISIYQKTISPDHGFFKNKFPNGFCRYYPTCSEYGKQAVKKYGLLRGGALGFWRILRCNPWSKGGIDELK